jgi:putative zinc finger/helix-turn-helix YgiT family protein
MKEQLVPTGTKCPECGEGQLFAFTRTEEFDFDLGDETVKVRAENVPVEKCDKCGEVMSGPAAAKVRHEAVCRAAGLLSPSEIKGIRETFGWSQQHLADLMGCGVATVSRWERGRLLQNKSSNKFLQGIRDCPSVREYYEGLLTSKAKRPESAFESEEVAKPVNRIKHRYTNSEDCAAYTAAAKAFDLRPSRN